MRGKESQSGPWLVNAKTCDGQTEKHPPARAWASASGEEGQGMNAYM